MYMDDQRYARRRRAMFHGKVKLYILVIIQIVTVSHIIVCYWNWFKIGSLMANHGIITVTHIFHSPILKCQLYVFAISICIENDWKDDIVIFRSKCHLLILQICDETMISRYRSDLLITKVDIMHLTSWLVIKESKV